MASVQNIGINGEKSKGETKDGQRDERVRRMEEDRVRKLRELELQFSLAKRHREQQEEERRRRIEEAKVKEAERRLQVEERKRQIWEAEQERKEAILRRNMEREARIEARRNAQRNLQSFAFGSSTPRLFDLDLAAIGARNQGTVLMCSIGRRSEEREMGPPRATSACSLDRKFGEDCMSRSMVSLSSSHCRGRKRTDIMPTLTRERSITPHITTSRGKDTSRSPSRPHSSLSGASDVSVSSVSAVQMRPAPRRPRPFSVAGSIVDNSTLSAMKERQPHERNVFGPIVKPQRAMSTSRETNELKNTRPLTAPKKPVLPPKPVEVLAKAKSQPVPMKDNLRKMAKPTKKPVTNGSKSAMDVKSQSGVHQNGYNNLECNNKDVPETELSLMLSPAGSSSVVSSPQSDVDLLPNCESYKGNSVVESDVGKLSISITESEFKEDNSSVSKSSTVATEKTEQKEKAEENTPNKAQLKMNVPLSSQSSVVMEKGYLVMKSEGENEMEDISRLMTTSLVIEKKKEKDIQFSMATSLLMENGGKEFMPSKPRITSEEEARAALAEKRRLAREQAEREAELERQRLEEIRHKEEEKRLQEEMKQKRMEEEQIRLAELHRQLEQEKLVKAIKEQQQREKEEQEKRDEEVRQKAEREELEKKAREEAEKQRIELEEKLRKEEEDRAERKRRVEQIMARTRGKSAAQSPSTPTENNKTAENNTTIVETPKTDPSWTNLVSSTKEHRDEKASVNGNHISNSWPFSEEKQHKSPLPDILNSSQHSGSFVEEQSKFSVNCSFSSSRTPSANEQTNGYSSHEEMSCTTSPEENADLGLLIDIQSCQQTASKTFSESIDFTKLVEVDPPSLDNVNNENYLINVDDINSNLYNSANPFAVFEESIQQKQDTPVSDLLS